MSTIIESSNTFRRGIHPKKESAVNVAEREIECLPTPDEVKIPLLQHIGASCAPTVKPKTEVAVGDVVGETDQFISAPCHASVAGKTGRPGMTTLPNGRHVAVVPIKADAEQPESIEDIYRQYKIGPWPTSGLEKYEPQTIATAAKVAGLVGLGGAAFPTHVKLTRNEKKPCDILILNGCECEPYLSSDNRLMIEFPEAVICGALLAQRATGAKEVVIGVEQNKPESIAALQKAAADTDIKIKSLKTKYPQGGEKQLIYAITGREVPVGSLPLDVGVVVINVGTSAALARGVIMGKPLTHRIVTVTGDGIVEPKNLLVPVGTSFKSLIGFCGGLKENAARVIAGGPMMGFALGSPDTPVTKGTSGIVILTEDNLKQTEETQCVRCGQCVDVCPMNLVPTKLGLASRKGRTDLMEQYYINACIECGSCSYTCPASIPLVQLIRAGKVMLRNAK